METYLQSRITDALVKGGVGRDSLPGINIDAPRVASHGDAATNVAMTLASVLRKSPRQSAQDIIDNLELDSQKITAAEIAGPGFINFRYSENYLYEQLHSLLESGDKYGEIGRASCRERG